MSQLTITLDDKLLHAAQEYARQRGQELDALVAHLLQTTVQPLANPPAPARPLSPRIQRLFGAVQVPADFDYEKVVNEAIQERYGA
ncbi:DUF6364 family protein [Hymenobacter nivis]|uniref:Uncharacterized protein n=1 Tax=Hymenobacter nivis TaxID=1850093 RepID=A0A502H2F6_9BACT|nr:DUF6364 family protein [Hymenobacter nivis]TPG67520.1 hypothetical protein EAH73_07365 [Hymenobacter nivis]